MGAEPIHRVLNAACGDVGTLTDMPLWSLFRPGLRTRLVGTDTLQIFVYSGTPWESEGQPFDPSEDGLDGPRNKDEQEVTEKVDGLEQDIEGVGVGLNQWSNYVKIDRFGTLSVRNVFRMRRSAVKQDLGRWPKLA